MAKTETVQAQVGRLASFILAEIDGEPSENEGAVDTAIRLLRERNRYPIVHRGDKDVALAVDREELVRAAYVADSTAGYSGELLVSQHVHYGELWDDGLVPNNQSVVHAAVVAAILDRLDLREVGEIRVVFDDPPSAVCGRFVEVETPDGASVNVGEWHERDDGLWELRIPHAILKPSPTSKERG